MITIARTGISTSNGHNFQTKKKYRISAGAKILFFSRAFMKVSSHHSFTLFRALAVGKVTKKSVPGGSQWGSVA